MTTTTSAYDIALDPTSPWQPSKWDLYEITSIACPLCKRLGCKKLKTLGGSPLGRLHTGWLPCVWVMPGGGGEWVTAQHLLGKVFLGTPVWATGCENGVCRLESSRPHSHHHTGQAQLSRSYQPLSQPSWVCPSSSLFSRILFLQPSFRHLLLMLHQPHRLPMKLNSAGPSRGSHQTYLSAHCPHSALYRGLYPLLAA